MDCPAVCACEALRWGVAVFPLMVILLLTSKTVLHALLGGGYTGTPAI